MTETLTIPRPAEVMPIGSVESQPELAISSTEALARLSYVHDSLEDSVHENMSRLSKRRLAGETDLGAQENAVADAVKKNELESLGVDLRHADLDQVLTAIIQGVPPLDIESVRLKEARHRSPDGSYSFGDGTFSASELTGIYLGQIFKRVSAEQPAARLITSLDSGMDNSGDFAAEATELLAKTEIGPDSVMVETRQEAEQFEALVGELEVVGKGQIVETAESIIFHPSDQALAEAGLMDTPEGLRLQSEGITLNTNGGISAAALEVCRLMITSQENAFHLAVLESDQATQFDQTRALIGGLDQNVGEYHAIIIDSSKIDPLLVASAIARQLYKDACDAKSDLTFKAVAHEGVDIDASEAPAWSAFLLADRFDEIDDTRAIELLPAIIDQLSASQNLPGRNSLCQKIIERYGESLLIDPAFESLWKSPEAINMIGQNYLIWRESRTQEDKERESKFRVALLRKAFSSMSLDESQTDEIMGGWFSTKVEHGRYQIARRNMRTMTTIFAERPDGPAELFKTFGIRNFGRYAPEDLLRQLSDYEAGVAPDYLTLVVSARDDWNGALKDFTRDLMKNEQATTPKGANEHILFVEAASVTELARLLIGTARHLKVIDRIMVSAHGSKDTLLFGKDRLTTNQIRSSTGASRLQDKAILAKDAEIIFKACSVGKPGGIAQATAERVGVPVAASPENTHALSEIVKRRWTPSLGQRGRHYISFVSDDKPVRINRFDASGHQLRSRRRMKF